MYRSTFSWLSTSWGWVVSFTPLLFTRGVRALGTHWRGGCVGPRVVLDDMEKWQFLTLLGLEFLPLSRPAHTQLLYWLHYHDSTHRRTTVNNISRIWNNSQISCKHRIFLLFVFRSSSSNLRNTYSWFSATEVWDKPVWSGNWCTMVTLTKQLLKELECPVCMEYFRQPIIMCRNGHSMCGKCRAQLMRCPLCRSDFLETRNRTLEILTRKISLACIYSSVGCSMKIMMAKITVHERNCHWRPFKCPKPNCACKCPLADMRNHLWAVHGTSLLRENRDSITLLRNFGTTSNWQRAILFSDEIFVHVCTVIEGRLYTCVLHVGLQEKTTRFSYSVQIKGQKATERQKAPYSVHNYISDMNQIIRSGNCAWFNYQFAQRCAGNESLLKMNVHLKHTYMS
jgi:hypothetical protein